MLPTICTISAPGAPSDVWALLGLELVISLSNTHSAGSVSHINTQKITSSADPDMRSFCSPPLYLSVQKINHLFVNYGRAGEIFPTSPTVLWGEMEKNGICRDTSAAKMETSTKQRAAPPKASPAYKCRQGWKKGGTTWRNDAGGAFLSSPS